MECTLSPVMQTGPIARGAASPHPSAPEKRVREVMRRDFITISECESLLEALQLMRLARLRHLAVEREGMLVGVLSYRDLQDTLLERLAGIGSPGEASPPQLATTVAGWATSAFSIAPDATLAEAAARLDGLRVGCLPVVEGSEQGARLVGLLTEMDLVRAAYGAT